MSEAGLPRRRLGRSTLEVNAIGMGCAPLGELFARVDDVAAQGTLQAACDGGIRYFDTAPEYGFGLSERRVGQFLRQRPHSEFILSTKVGRLLHAPRDVAKYRKTFWTGGLEFDFRFDYGYDAIMRSVEDSYQRLGPEPGRYAADPRPGSLHPWLTASGQRPSASVTHWRLARAV